MRPPALLTRSTSASLLLRWCTSVSTLTSVCPASSQEPRMISLSPTFATMQRWPTRSTSATAAVVPSIISWLRAICNHSSSVCTSAFLNASLGSDSNSLRSAANNSHKRSPANSAALDPAWPSKIAKYDMLPNEASMPSLLQGLDAEGLQPSSPKTARWASSISLRMFWIECTPYLKGLPKELRGETIVVNVRLPERRSRE
mmetsp:Transcript_22468/g.64592  ORF Transcript_22468/g.64592 Transcript_22468/m.64592 type:complete len:201 (+) Transcript_22468:390-992(+)